MNKLPNLPVGDSSFESIRRNGCLYVDKTRHFFRLADQGKYYFLSRPRRFGKSLTVSTLRCLFEGRRELFDGLWIAQNTDWDWKEHPVIQLDFNEISHETPESLQKSLEWSLLKTAQSYGLVLHAPLIKDQFKELILSLSQKTGMPTVILIDEYDKPLIDHLGRGEAELDMAKANRDILKRFFGVMKGGEVADVLRFVFITGVSKFSRVSIFSELNNLEDLTMVEEYADMPGYTLEETATCFAPYIRLTAQKRNESEEDVLERLKLNYDGYRFSKRDVRIFNPFSVLCALKQRDFKKYWFETGTPTFLVNLLRENNWYLPEIENLRATEALFSVYELERLQLEALLFQTGYVTIKDVDEELYTFDYPNQEVKTAFLEVLLHAYTRGGREVIGYVMLSRHLMAEDLSAFVETMNSIYASIPYTLETKRDEAYFHTVFYLMVSASGVNVRSEVLTCDGRIDLAVHFPDKVYIMEFKCNQSADTALQQIRDKGYERPYRQRGLKIIRVGINFDTEARNVGEWKSETA